MGMVFTPEEAAAFLKVHPNTVYKLLQSGQIPAARVGRGWRISGEAMDAYLRGEHPARRSDAETRGWMDSDLSGLGRFEPYDWGPEGPPETSAVRYRRGVGPVIEGPKRYE